MLALVFLLVGCAALQSHALPALVQYQAKDELGQYSYGYSGGPSAKQEERTLDGVTRGSYSYIDGNGLVQTRSYEADDLHGFRVVGTDISAPTGVSRSGTILSSTGLPVYDHTPVKTYQSVPYVRNDYNDVRSFSGNEISISPIPYSVRKTIIPHSTPIQYLNNPYTYQVPQKYYQKHYISPNSLEVSPLSSIGIRVPPTYSQPISPIAYSDSGVQSTVTPPTIYTNEVPIAATVAPAVQTVSIQESQPIRASYTPTYASAASKIVSSYVPQYVSGYSSPAVSYRANAIAITNPNPAPISYLDAAPSPVVQPAVTISGPSPTIVAYTQAVPAAAVAAAQPAVAISNPAPIVEYDAVPGNPTVVTYAEALPAQPTVAISNPPPVEFVQSAPAVSFSTPLSYGYYPTTSNIVRYASAAPSVRATVYEPAGGYLAAKPVPLQEAIATQYHAQDELGQYRYGYANINSAKEESKTLDGVTRGSFSYVDANGVLQSRSYVSDDINGFRVIGTDIPKDPNGHVNPDAIPSEHVAPAAVAAPIVHSEPVVSAVPLSPEILHVNSPVFVSSTPSPLGILK